MIYLLADAALQALESGVPQIVLQTGAFGLLMWIVIRSFPQMMESQRSERLHRDDLFARLIDQMQIKFEERNERIVSAVEKQTQQIAESLDRAMLRLENSVMTKLLNVRFKTPPEIKKDQ